MKEEIERLKQFMKDFSLFIKKSYHIAWGVEKIQRVKVPKFQWEKTEE